MELKDAITRGDENAQALVYSGIRAIEIAVNEYLDKYALSAKISQAVNVFKGIVNNLHLEKETEEALVKNRKKREDTIKQLKNVIDELARGDKAGELIGNFRVQIKERLSELDPKIKSLTEGIYAFFANQQKKFEKEDIEVNAAQKLVEQTVKEICLRYEILCADIDRLLKKELLSQAKDYLDQYKSHVEDLMKDNRGYVLDTALNLVQVSIPSNPNELIGKFTKTETWTIKEEKEDFWSGVGRFFGKIFGKDEWGYEYVTHSKNVVKIKNLFDAQILPFQDEFKTTINSCKEKAETEILGLQKYFEKQIEKLDAKVQEYAAGKLALLSEKGNLEASIKENEGKKAWLERFHKDLDAVLEV